MAITLHTEEQELPEQTEMEVGRFRDDFQKQIDADVKALKLKTAKAKWPAHDPAKLFHRYVVSADDLADMKSVIRRAASFIKVTPVWYKTKTTEAGHKVIKFHVDRRLVNPDDPSKGFVKDDTLNDDGTPKPEPTAQPSA